MAIWPCAIRTSIFTKYYTLRNWFVSKCIFFSKHFFELPAYHLITLLTFINKKQQKWIVKIIKKLPFHLIIGTLKIECHPSWTKLLFDWESSIFWNKSPFDMLIDVLSLVGRSKSEMLFCLTTYTKNLRTFPFSHEYHFNMFCSIAYWFEFISECCDRICLISTAKHKYSYRKQMNIFLLLAWFFPQNHRQTTQFKQNNFD